MDELATIPRAALSLSADAREVIAEALWRHETRGLPAAKRARDAERFADQSETTRNKWLGFADAILASGVVAVPDEEPADMAALGRAVMTRIETIQEEEGSFKDWIPAECPSEIITDLHEALLSAREAPSNEAAIRADEQERCAKVCDQIRNNTERRAAEHENGEARNSALDKMEGAIQCATAIRARGSK
ncbi:MAG: hypothetical protein J0G95_11010 [Rhizobiales bacterium]|nr:hypothetical protein [Hyphomicrobiales bacterium]